MEIKCFVCNNDNKEQVYLKCIHEGTEKFVCARCLPVLIHGSH